MDSLSPQWYRDESVESSVRDTTATIKHIQTIDPTYAIVSPIVTPRFAPSSTSQLLLSLGTLARDYDLPVQTHISENHGEIELVQELFPKYKHYTDVYDEHGLLGPKTILAHAVHLSDAERTVISQRQAKVSHCPASNTALASGTAKVRWLLDGGVDVGLGTDVSGGYSPSILDAARQSLLVSRHLAMRPEEGEKAKLSVEEVLYLATRGGAKVLAMEDKVGAFGVGMEWDAQLIGLEEVTEDGWLEGPDKGLVDVFGWEVWDDKVAKWLFNGDDRNTLAVWVKGRLVHERR
jgi:guanine deaminase